MRLFRPPLEDPRGSRTILGQGQIHSVVDDQVLGDDLKPASAPDNNESTDEALKNFEDPGSRNIFLPIDHGDGSNPDIEVQSPYPGIFIYRFSEGFNYPNANHYLDQLTNTIFAETRRTNIYHYPRPGDRPWNDSDPRRDKATDTHADRPTLKAIILDFSSVNNADVTSIQQLIDVRNQLDRYTSPSVVDWHFASLNNRWTKRALVAAGFRYPSVENFHGSSLSRKPIFSIARIGGSDSAAAAAEASIHEKQLEQQRSQERERHLGDSIQAVASNESSGRGLNEGSAAISRVAVVNGLNRPLFHIDLTSAFQSAIANVQIREEVERQKGVEIEGYP